MLVPTLVLVGAAAGVVGFNIDLRDLPISVPREDSAGHTVFDVLPFDPVGDLAKRQGAPGYYCPSGQSFCENDQFRCKDPGDFCCENSLNACPVGNTCCLSSCARPGYTCCPDWGSCENGYTCCADGSCNRIICTAGTAVFGGGRPTSTSTSERPPDITTALPTTITTVVGTATLTRTVTMGPRPTRRIDLDDEVEFDGDWSTTTEKKCEGQLDTKLLHGPGNIRARMTTDIAGFAISSDIADIADMIVSLDDQQLYKAEGLLLPDDERNNSQCYYVYSHTFTQSATAMGVTTNLKITWDEAALARRQLGGAGSAAPLAALNGILIYQHASDVPAASTAGVGSATASGPSTATATALGLPIATASGAGGSTPLPASNGARALDVSVALALPAMVAVMFV